MRVLGMGTDVVDIPTFSSQLGLPGSRLGEVFTSRERRRADRRATESGAEVTADPTRAAQHLAAVWAVKEAFIKAWSGALYGQAPPLSRDGLDFSEIEVRHDRWGRPGIDVRGRVAEALSSSVTGPVRLLASASHDGEVACAVVILESD